MLFQIIFPRRRWRDAFALLILALGVSLLHIRGLWPGQAFLPVDLANNLLPWQARSPQPLQNWLISDPLYVYYPYLSHAVDAVREAGRWPLWNPHILLGHPAFADPVAQTFYPVFLGLGLLFGAARGLTVGLWLHAVLAAALTYSWLRELRCRRPAAVLGAFTYALGGYMATWFETPFWVATLTWLPGVLWAFECAVQRKCSRCTALAGLFMGFAILGGQFQFILTFSLFLALYALGGTVVSARARRSMDLWPLTVLVTTMTVGVLLSAIQIVPFLKLFSRSHRALTQGGLHPLPVQQLITLIVPDFYGNPATVGSYWGTFNFGEHTIYAGLPALLLASLIPLYGHRRWPRYMFGLAIVILYCIVGSPGIEKLAAVPVLRNLSLHRSAFLLPLIIAPLAAVSLSRPQPMTRGAAFVGIGLAVIVGAIMYLNREQVQDHWPALRGPVLRAAGLLVVAIAFLALRDCFPNLRSQAEWGFVGLVFVDLFLFGNQYNPTGPVDDLLPLTPAIKFLRSNSGLHRVAPYQRDEQVVLGPNIPSVYGLFEAGGYSSLVSTRLQQLVQAGDPKTKVTGAGQWMKLNPNIVFFNRPSRRLLDLLQVAYVILPAPLSDPGVRTEYVVEGCAAHSGKIAGDHTISGAFTIRDSAINRLDLRLRVYQPELAGGTLVVRLWQGAGRERLVLESHLDAGELEDREMVTLYFAPEKAAPGRTYHWEVSAAEGNPSTGVGLCTDTAGQPTIAVYGAHWTEAYAGAVYIHERLARLPRAYVVYAAERIPDDTKAVSRLLDNAFDFRNVAVTAKSLPLAAEADIPATPAKILIYEDRRVVIDATATRQGLLILGDQFFPGWNVYVDGEPATMRRVNHILRGAVLPAGRHQVEFRLAPTSLRTGGLLSLVGVLAVFALATKTVNIFGAQFSDSSVEKS